MENGLKMWNKKPCELITQNSFRGGSRGTSNNFVGEQNSNYLLRKTKMKEILLSYTGVRRTING